MTHIKGAYTIVRGSKGFVSCVTKKRVKTPDGRSTVKDVERVCGLGVMTQQEFEVFKAWAKQFKGEERRAMVLSSGRAISVREHTEKEVIADKQKKTTVKRVKKEIIVLPKEDKSKERIEKHKKWFATLTDKEKQEYKKIHRKGLLEDQRELQEHFKKIKITKKKSIEYPKNVLTIKDKKAYLKIHEKIVKNHKKKLQDNKYTVGQSLAYSGLYGTRREKADIIRLDKDLGVCDAELMKIEKEQKKLK